MPWLGAQGRVSWVLGLDGPCSCHVGTGLPGPRWQLPVWREHRDVCRVQDSSVRPDEASASAAGPRAPSAAGRTPRDVSQLVLGAGLRRPRTPRPIHRFGCMAFRQLPGLASKHGCCCGHSGRAPRAHAGAPAVRPRTGPRGDGPPCPREEAIAGGSWSDHFTLQPATHEATPAGLPFRSRGRHVCVALSVEWT